MSLAPKWTPAGLAVRVRSVIHEPADVALAARLGLFLWRAPHELASRHLHDYLRELEQQRRRVARTRPRDAQLARIERIRQAWLRMPFFRTRDSCYLRSLTLYRFWNAGDEPMHLHFGVEERTVARSRRHAHVWISVGAQTFEGPPPDAGRLREVTLSEMPA
jgi:hypothetical protein